MTELRVHGRPAGSEPTYAAELGELVRVILVAGIATGVLIAGLGIYVRFVRQIWTLTDH